MKIIIIGADFEAIYEPAQQEHQNLRKRLGLDVEIWNRDHASDQRHIIESEAWPLPDPLPPEEE